MVDFTTPLVDLLKLLQTLSPLAVIGLLGLVLLKMASRKQLHKVSTNDLHELPEMIRQLGAIGETLQRIEKDNAVGFARIEGMLIHGNKVGRRSPDTRD